MAWKTILCEKLGNVSRIMLNRPEVRNAQSRVMIEELDEALQQAEADDEIRVIVIGGTGPHFSAGHDMGSKEELEDRERRPFPPNTHGRVKRSEYLFRDATLRLRNISKPTIAMVQGYCIMGGLKLVSACDIIIATEDARFADRSVRQGAPHVQYASLPWEVGIRKAKEFLFTGDFIDAQEAWRLGLVNRVVPGDRLEEETMQLANRIALQDPFALKLCKASLNETWDIMGFTQGIMSAFKSHQLASERRATEGFSVPRKPGESVADWVARRDQNFGDHR